MLNVRICRLFRFLLLKMKANSHKNVETIYEKSLSGFAAFLSMHILY